MFVTMYLYVQIDIAIRAWTIKLVTCSDHAPFM